MSEFDFNPDDWNEEPAETPTYTPLEVGEYDVKINDAEKKDTQIGPKVILKVELMDGARSGESHFIDMLYEVIGNENWTADCKRRFSQLCRVSGVGHLKDSSDFIGRTARLNIEAVRPINRDGKTFHNYRVSWLPAKSAGFVDTPF
jgi:hypothetical protein